MRLEKLIVVNLKSCKNVGISFEKDQPTTLIGKNDSGKSVVLNAIGCLLANKPIKAETAGLLTSDISNTPLAHAEFEHLFSDSNLPEFKGSVSKVVEIDFRRHRAS